MACPALAPEAGLAAAHRLRQHWPAVSCLGVPAGALPGASPASLVCPAGRLLLAALPSVRAWVRWSWKRRPHSQGWVWPGQRDLLPVHPGW